MCMKKDKFLKGNLKKIKKMRTMGFREFFNGFKIIDKRASSLMFGYMMNFVNIPGVVFSSLVNFFKIKNISQSIHFSIKEAG